MCGFCGSFAETHWSALPAAAKRPMQGRLHLAEIAARAAAPSGVRVTVWGEGFRVAGPTGRVALVADLPGLWNAVDQLGREPPDPLDASFLDRLEEQAAP